MNEHHQRFLVTRSTRIAQTIRVPSGRGQSRRSFQSAQGDAVVQLRQKCDQAARGRHRREMGWLEKRHGQSRTALAAVVAFVVQLKAWAVGMIARVLMMVGRRLLMALRRIHHFVCSDTLSGMAKRLAGSRKPLQRECKHQPTDNQDAQDFHAGDATPIHSPRLWWTYQFHSVPSCCSRFTGK